MAGGELAVRKKILPPFAMMKQFAVLKMIEQQRAPQLPQNA
jgi:hypothetical protein